MGLDSTNPTDTAQQKFLTSFARNGNVTKAAKAARVDRSTPYTWRDNDPKFAEAWEVAREAAADVLEAEAFRRAVTGTNKGVYHQGVLVNTEKQYSDRLLELLLKANRPDKYRDHSSVELSGQQDITITRRIIGADES